VPPPHLLLLPSPFLGPAPYAPVAAALSSRGYAASVAPSPASPVAADLIASWGALVADLGDVVLVPHSNAGYLAPAVSATSGAPVVFVDAALPAGPGPTRLAPPAFRSHLATLAGPDGRLPRWTRWWPREDVAAVLPDPWFERLDAGLPELPLSYVDDAVPVPTGWQDGRCAYLAFGSTYADELDLAVRHGWPHRRLAGAGHLHLLVEADEAAAAVAGLVARVVG
jgi:hypothetical protein